MTRNYAEEDYVKKGLASLATSLGSVAGDVAQIASDGTVTLSPGAVGSGAADYILWTSAGVSQVLTRFGVSVYSGSDAAAGLQAAIDASGTGGATILIVGAVSWGSVPNVPAGITGKLHIRGLGSTVVTLTTAGRRFLDFNKTADYQTFKNIEISDLTIDVNNVGGQHHVVIGTYIGGVTTTRINVQNVAVRRVRTTNVPVDSSETNHRLNVFIVPKHTNDNEGTINTVSSVVVEDCRFEGGNQGVVIGGTGPAAGTVNIVLDDIRISRCWHSLLAVQSSHFSSGNFQVGSRARGGSASIRDCYGAYAGDVGIEVNGLNDIIVDGCVIEDAHDVHFYFTNFQALTNTSEQKVEWINCRAIRVLQTQGAGFKPSVNDARAIGRLVIRDCSYYRNEPTVAANAPTTADHAIQIGGGVTMESLTIDNFDCEIEGLSYDSATANAVFYPFYLAAQTSGRNNITIRNSHIKISGARTGVGAGTLTVRTVYLTGLMHLLIDGLSIEQTITGMASNTQIGIDLGLTSSEIRGVIRRFFPKNGWTSDTAPRGMLIRGTSTLTITQALLVEDCDFSLLPSGSSDILFSTVPQNQSKVFFRDNKWRVFPKPSAAMGTSNFAAATFTTATGNQYVGGSPAEIHFATGTGSGITLIEVSKDGSTYEEVYTQASGAMAQTVLVPVDNGDSVRVTFSTTQPTTRVRFRK